MRQFTLENTPSVENLPLRRQLLNICKNDCEDDPQLLILQHDSSKKQMFNKLKSRSCLCAYNLFSHAPCPTQGLDQETKSHAKQFPNNETYPDETFIVYHNKAT